VQATLACIGICSLLVLARSSEAGQAKELPSVPATITVPGLPVPIFGPPPPQPPETSARDAAGRLTIRAVRLTAPLQIDGRLDEPIYAETPPVSDFIQLDPNEGAPASQRTEFWVFFDDSNVYVVFRVYESNLKGMVVKEMRRDHVQLSQNEFVNFYFDTFYDRRNSQGFLITPAGGRMDGQLENETQFNGDWNPVWNLKTGRFDGGWTAEAAVPFKSLRYRPGRSQVWGLNVSRYNRWKNEVDVPVPMPRSRFTSVAFQTSQAPTLVGIEAPPLARNLELKPYVISSLSSDLLANPTISNDVTGDFGGDVKYGVTRGLTADFTYNTDFAQVEVDEQQVNLTRFSLFFPEKREFFLENQGIFSFGGISPTTAVTEAPILFYSRQIGLNGTSVVPIRAGGRVTGRAGPFSVGVLDIETKDVPSLLTPASNFSVVRIKRGVLRRSSVGALFTGRSVTRAGIGSNQTYGVDGTFAFYQNLAINTYWARTETTGRRGDDTSYRGQLNYTGDRYGVQAEQLGIGANFNPEVGFVRRTDIQKSFGLFRFSPRPHAARRVRRYFYQGSLSYIQDGGGRRQLRDIETEAAIEYQNSDRLAFDYSEIFENIPVPFAIAPAVTVPIGGYEYRNAKLSFLFGQHRRLSGTAALERGTLYGGEKTAASVSSGRINVTAQLSVEPTISLNHVSLPGGTFNTNLVGTRITYGATPLMFVSALVQYNSSTHSIGSNVRLRWEYQPGSELFVVYNDQRDTLQSGFPTLANRAFVVKVNRLIRF
jgi:hypothetical protein